MTEIPEAFDWVTARSKCTLELTYLVLMERVDSDLKKMQELTPPHYQERLQLTQVTSDKHVASRQRNAGGILAETGIVFERLSHAIHVRTAEAQTQTLFMAKPFLTPEGRCMLEVEQHGLLYPWQVSKLALEKMFFGG